MTLRIALLICLCAWIGSVSASLRGTGEMTAGASIDNRETTYGFASAYEIQSMAPNYELTGSMDIEHAKEGNRPSVIGGHQYLYGGSELNANIDQVMKTALPSVQLISGAGVMQSVSQVNLGEENRMLNYYVGPSFSKDIGRSWALESSAILREQTVNESKDQGLETQIQLIKSLTSLLSFGLGVERSCWKYEDTGTQDDCNNRYLFSLNKRGSRTDTSFRFSENINNDQKNTELQLTINYMINSADRFLLTASKRNINYYQRFEVISDLESINTNTEVSQVTVGYSKQFKRSEFAFNGDKRAIKSSDTDEITESGYRVNLNHYLGSKNCPSCRIELQYQSSDRETANWNSWNLGVSYPIKKNWKVITFLQHTKVTTDNDELLSLNFQIQYNGNSRILVH